MAPATQDPDTEKVELTDDERRLAMTPFGGNPEETQLPEEEEPETPADGNSGESEAGDGNSAGKKAAEENSSGKGDELVVSDETIEMAKIAGLSDSVIKNATEDELTVAIKMYGKSLESPAETTGEEEAGEQNPTPEEEFEENEDEKFVLDLDPEQFRKEGYDEETIKLVTAVGDVNKNLQGQIDKLTQQMYGDAGQNAAVARNESFHDAVDSLEDDRLGQSLNSKGEAANLGKSESEFREDIGKYVELLEAKSAKDGKNPPNMGTLVKMATKIVLADDNQNRSQKRHADKLRKQSRRRSGSPSKAKAQTRTVKKDEFEDELSTEDIANDPEIKEMWERFDEENG
jgi:uncharacterized Zn finger protein